ncbi:MAG: 4-hydroxybenzoate octaprenyltransferase [Chlamydiae bacterium]|nr:4-hydroxybenzoate octaprenyltransferase [Chlamydiota bacterium]MBI3277832.1 4-hydroxybenzoate octaprenyltransferase [Chlamydiota bacterium]
MNRLVHYARLIRLSHSVFALPFALSTLILVHPYHEVTLHKIIWILIAMVSARSAAMGFNRIIDREIDKKNPRTSQRELPQGIVTLQGAFLFTILCAIIFIFSAFKLNAACGLLSIPTLILFFFYPYAKRLTWTCHLFLGLSLALSPIGVWLAIANSLQGPVLLLSLGVLFWVSGFDVIYACQDLEFDQTHHLLSIPQKFGIPKALTLAMIFHGLTISCFIWVGISFKLNLFYFMGCGIISIAMLYQHYLISPKDLSRVEKAFNTNGTIGFIYLLAIWMGMR